MHCKECSVARWRTEENGENKEQGEHPKHASLIRRIENQYRLSVSEPISRTAACSAANVKRDVHQNEICPSPVTKLDESDFHFVPDEK